MRRFLGYLATTLTAGSLMGGFAAAATSGCSLVNTGPNSNNTCNVTSNNNLQVTCNNSTDVVFVNRQSSNSGSVTLTNNTNGGYSYSGNAVNTNSTTGQLDVSCGAKVAAAPTTSTTPSTSTPAPTTTPAPAVSNLPNTGSNSLVADSAITLGAIAVLALAARVGLLAYRQHSLK